MAPGQNVPAMTWLPAPWALRQAALREGAHRRVRAAVWARAWPLPQEVLPPATAGAPTGSRRRERHETAVAEAGERLWPQDGWESVHEQEP